MELERLPSSTLVKFCDALDVSPDEKWDKRKMCREIFRRAALLRGAAAAAKRARDELDDGDAAPREEIAPSREIQPEVLPPIVPKGQKGGFTTAQYRALLRWAFTFVKVVVSAAATVISFGGAGDTLTDIAFSIADAGLLINSIRKVLDLRGPATVWIKRIYDIPWRGEPDDVKKEMDRIFQEIDADENAREIKDALCSSFGMIVDNVAALFGSLISALIPDDFGASRIVLEYIIKSGKGYAGRGPYASLAWIYKKMPQAAQDALKDKESIQNLITAIISGVQNSFPTKDTTFGQRLRGHVGRSIGLHLLLPLVPFGILVMPVASTLNVAVENERLANSVREWIQKKVVPQIPAYADLATHFLPLAFASTLVFSKC
jgi:hypothetical protein